MSEPLLGFVVALSNEWKYFSEAFTGLQRGHCGDLTEYRGRFGDLECVVVIGGAGRENAANAARTLLEHHEIGALISLGYAGALSPELSRGDIVLSAYSVTGANPDIAPWELELEQSLRRFAGPAQSYRVNVGPFFTAGQVVARRDDKRTIFEETGAAIVDMESASLFNVAREDNIPFLSIRAITDTSEEEIRALEAITPFLASRSFWRYPRIFWDIATHPKFIGDLVALGKSAQLAGNNLSHFMKSNIPALCALVRSSIESYPRAPTDARHI